MKHKQSTWLAVINQRSKDWFTEIRDRGGINGSVPDWEALTDAAWVLAETQIFTIGINDLVHALHIYSLIIQGCMPVWLGGGWEEPAGE